MLPDCLIRLKADDGGRWSAEYVEHGLGIVPMFVMPYNPDDDRPFGVSRINSEVRWLIDCAMRAGVNEEVAAAFAASGRRRLPALPAGAWPYILGSGLFGCVYNRLNIFLAGWLPSVVFYPTFNGAVILLSTLCGLLLFRERLRARQTIGMIAGIAALLLASGAFDSFFA